MGFSSEKIKDFYLLSTDVENIFINEYMPTAPGDYVKVFLYGLLYSKNQSEITSKQFAGQLQMNEKQVEEAWNYWEQLGIVSKRYIINTNDYDIEFKNLRAMMYSGLLDTSKPEPSIVAAEEDTPLVNEILRDLIHSVEQALGRVMSPKESMEVASWYEELGATTEVIMGAVEYCIEKGKRGINYMAKVVLQWTKDGFKTAEDVQNHISSLEARYGNYKRILQALGLNRAATEAERDMIDSWFDEMDYNMDRVMDACVKASFISSPNIRYVNKVLENWAEEAKIDGRNVNNKLAISKADLNRYYEHLRKEAEAQAEARKMEVYDELPRIEEVDKELLSLGMKLSRTLLGGNASEVEKTKKFIEHLEEERAVLLTENNYPEDYTDVKYLCDKCSDTGVTDDGGRCSCVKERMGEAELWLNSSSSKS